MNISCFFLCLKNDVHCTLIWIKCWKESKGNSSCSNLLPYWLSFHHLWYMSFMHVSNEKAQNQTNAINRLKCKHLHPSLVSLSLLLLIVWHFTFSHPMVRLGLYWWNMSSVSNIIRIQPNASEQTLSFHFKKVLYMTL